MVDIATNTTEIQTNKSQWMSNIPVMSMNGQSTNTQMGSVYTDITLDQENKIKSYIESKYSDRDSAFKNQLADKLYLQTKWEDVSVPAKATISADLPWQEASITKEVATAGAWAVWLWWAYLWTSELAKPFFEKAVDETLTPTERLTKEVSKLEGTVDPKQISKSEDIRQNILNETK